jgi:hypothetical protein
MLTEVKERPILFSGPMVRAILDGRKTQTRRIVKGSTEFSGPYNPEYMEAHKDSKGWASICPYGSPGERLWVREAWAPATAALPLADGVLYRADYHTSLEKRDGDQKWKPSIHMRRVDSRINLEITGVRVERLNAICEEDAKSEGVEGLAELFEKAKHGHPLTPWSTAFAWLWFEINGRDSWMQNPWVWVVEFKRNEQR